MTRARQQLEEAIASARKKRGRYPVVPAEERTVDGIVFDSKREAKRYVELKLRERAGEITHLTLQPTWRVTIAGAPYCQYTADFCYFESGQRVVEDVKSSGTRKDAAYRLRKKAAELTFHFRVTET